MTDVRQQWCQPLSDELLCSWAGELIQFPATVTGATGASLET